MNLELKALVKAGARLIQIDEPYYSGFPEDIDWGVKVLNTLVDGVDAQIAVHICYGNRYGKPPGRAVTGICSRAILDAKVHQLTLEFARRGRRGSGSVQGVSIAVRVGAGRDRREDSRHRDAGNGGGAYSQGAGT